MPITPKAIQDLLDELESSKQSRLRAWNVLQRLRLVLSFWEVQPVPLLELCLGSFSKESPLQSALEKIRVAEQDNGSLDKVAKKMRAREKRFGSDWYFQGHHPQEDYAALEQGTGKYSVKTLGSACENIFEIWTQRIQVSCRQCRTRKPNRNTLMAGRHPSLTFGSFPSRSSLLRIAPTGPAEFNVFKQQVVTTLDVRPAAVFGDGHAAGSLNIGVAGPSFSVWCGFFVNPDLPIALVVEYETETEQAQLEQVRVGFDQIVGFISADDLDETLQITQIGARDFLASMEGPRRPLIVDVRSAQEWSHNHLEGAIHIPLPQLPPTYRRNFAKCASDS